MSFRSLASLRVAVSFAALLVLSACSDNRQAQLSAVETIEVPLANANSQANQNISNPTLAIPVTFPVEDGDELTLVFSDEFNGPEIDPEVWFFATGDGAEKGVPSGWGNNELQYYLPDNAMIVNGVLELTARRETVGDFNYTSARINTEDRFAFKYGRIEASIKMPSGQGLLPAFWMLSQSEDLSKNSDYTCGGDECIWAAIGEIDIVEASNPGGTGGNDILGTIHYGGESPGNLFTTTYFTPSVDITETFNTYALEWDEDEIRWYFNGELYATQPESAWFSTADNGGEGAPFNQPFHILLNVAVGGDNPGSPNGTTPWPVTMEVDWVRVYSGEPPPAGAGTAPENAVFVTDPNVTADLAAPILDNFGSGATFNAFYAGDPDFKPTLQVISGDAFGGEDVGFVAFRGYEAGFAADYQTFSFKVKGLPGDELEIKFFGSPENSIIINLGTYAGATDLGNGWYQVTVPMSDFAANVYAFTGFLIGPPGDQGAPFSFLLTDIGFNGAIVTTPADAGTMPDVTLYARGGATDLVFGEDYAAIEVFGSGAIINDNNTGDVDFSPAISVSTGFGYEKWNAQAAVTGFEAGFAADYLTLDFKVKGMAGDVIRVKLLNVPNPDYVDVDLTSADYATSLGNGWYQVVVPIEEFPGDVETASGLLFETIEPAPDASFTFLLNDIGFSGAVEVADPGVTPEFVLFGTTAAADVAIPADGPQNFGSGASFDFEFADTSFDPVIAVTAGNGYSGVDNPENWVAFLAVINYASPIAVGYDTFNVKVKGSPLGTIEVKLIGGGDDSIFSGDLTTYAGSTDLGDGWYQLEIPFTDFTNPANIPNHTGWLIGPPGDQGDAAFVFLLTDVGFSNAGGATADPGTTPEFVLFGTTAAADVAIPADGPQNFGSGASFDFEFADTSFDPVIAVTAGNGYSGVDNPENWVAFLAVINYASPIAVGYDTFNVKVKGSPLGTIEVKLIGGGDDSIFSGDLTTYAGSTDLGDGWYQLEIPFTDFTNPANIPNHTGWLIGPPGDQGDAAFVFLLTDVGFSNAGGATADPGTTPEFVLFGTTAAADVAIPADGPQNFGSGASFDFEFADTSFDPVIAVTAGNGYSGVDNPENWVAFLAVINYASPIAVGYDTFNVKVKGSPLGTIEVKLIGGGDDSIFSGDLTTYAGSTDLGDGWYQLEIPFTDFTNPANIPNHTGWLIGPPGDQGDAAFVFLLTDVGFSNAGGGTGLELLTNGDFEAGDTSGWESGGSGSFSATMDQATGPGEWSGNLSAAGGGSNILIKQANLAVGTVAPNQPINVSLDYCGSNTGIGGVIKLELLSEFGGDGGASRDELGQLTLTSTWQAVTFSSTTGDNVAGGVTLQIIADCGGNADCAIDAYLDNISVTLDNDVGNVSGAGGACSGSDGGGGTGGTGDELVVNGDFETGEFGGWTTSGIGASTTIVSPGAGSAFAASIDSSGSPGNATLKQANLGAGQLSPNQIVTVSFDYRGAAATGGVINVNLFSEGSSGVSQTVELLGPGDAIPTDWTAFGPLSVDVGSDVSGGLTLEVAVVCGAEASCEASLFLDNVSITIGGDAGGGGGTGGGGGGTGVDIAINGGFETGLFNDGTENASWQTFPNGGIQTIVTDNPSEGTYAANLNVPVRGPTDGPVDNLLKNANLEAGNLTPGASITITWDMRGSLQGVGGVVFVELFSEFAGGGATGEIYTGGPIFPDDPDVWSSYTWTTTLGADVSGGVTLQLKASCGPVEGCGVDAYFDNVTIVTAVTEDTGGGDTGGGDTGGGGTGGGDTVLATFDETTPLVVTAFGGAVSMIETGPAGGDGSIALNITRDNGLNYAGAWVAIPAIPSNAGTQTVSALVYSPTAGIPMVAKAEFGEAAGTGDVQANEAVVVGWQTLTWTFTNLDPGQVYNRFVMLPNLGTVDTTATSYFFDNITLLGAGG